MLQDGYIKARKLLTERCGNEFIITQSWIGKVTADGVFKGNNSRALQDFSDDLRNCLETLQAMDCLSEINTQGNLLKITERLPPFLQSAWRKKVMSLKRKEERLPRLEDLVSFVEDAAEEANDPIYGYGMKQQERIEPEKEANRQKPKRHASYSTEVKSSQDHAKCLICDGPHAITSCSTFQSLRPNERFEAVRKKGLCFNCLKPAHSSQNCRSEKRCTADGCGRKHSRLLHQDDFRMVITSHNKESKDKQEKDQREATSIQNAHVDTSCFTGAGAKRIALPIVAVKVREPGGCKSIETYALLDSGSTASFCSDKLFNKLGVKGHRERISVTTLGQAGRAQDIRVTSLEVSDIYETNVVSLPAVYGKETLPIGFITETAAMLTGGQTHLHSRGPVSHTCRSTSQHL